MTFKEMVLQDQATFFNLDEFGEEVLYNGLPIVVIPNLGTDLVNGNILTEQGTTARAIFYLQVTDVTVPQRGDTLTYNGVDWSVSQLIYTKQGQHKVLCTSRESVY